MKVAFGPPDRRRPVVVVVSDANIHLGPPLLVRLSPQQRRRIVRILETDKYMRRRHPLWPRNDSGWISGGRIVGP